MKKNQMAFKAMAAVLLLMLAVVACKKEPRQIPVDPNSTDYVGGVTFNPDADPIPKDIPRVGGANLPSKVDLSYLLPPVGDQKGQATCVAWSSAYYIRTAMLALRYNLGVEQLKSPANQFSPKDLYLAVPSQYKDPNCNAMQFNEAFNTLIQRGVATMASAPYENLGDCSQSPEAAWTSEAAKYKIDSYRQLDRNMDEMKAKLAEQHPFLWVTSPTQAFLDWKTSAVMHYSDIMTGPAKYYHAITVIGYDDSKHAFRIVNSWGNNWADHGFAWVDYDLMINSNFALGGAVLYDKPVDVSDPSTPPSAATNLSANYLQDLDDDTQNDLTYRKINFSVGNTGQQPVSSASDWHIYYLYYDAFDASRYGVLLDMYVSNDFGNPGDVGYYADGAGSSYSEWVHTDMPAGSLLSEQLFGPGYTSINWPYQMPSLNGYYYLVMIVDPYNAVGESNESDNFFFTTGADGGPLWLENGVIKGLQPGEVKDRSEAEPLDSHTPVNAGHPNAYRPEEIKAFIKRLKDEGKLPRPVKNAHGKPLTVAS